MSLRLRLIIAFFLLSVVPLGAVTFYSYRTNADALREAAGREAEMLAGDLTDRMQLVMAQLGQQFQRLMEMPANAPADSAGGMESAADSASAPPALVAPVPTEAEQMAAILGETAVLLNNIDVRGIGRGRPSSRRSDAEPPGGSAEDGEAAPGVVPEGGRVGAPNGRAGASRGSSGRGRGDGPPSSGASGRGQGGPPADAADDDPTRIQIDLGPVRRAIFREVAPDVDRMDQLSPEERRRIIDAVNERVLGIEQGIQIVQQEAAERAAEARAQADAAAKSSPAPRAPDVPQPPGPLPAAPVAPAETVTTPGSRVQRLTELTGSRLDVRLEQNGEVLGQVNAEINVPNLLAAVFTAARRERGEVPFAIDRAGQLYTPTFEDRERIESIGSPIIAADTPPATTVAGNWVVVTTADPTGSEVKFGIARPLGEALDDLRRTSVRNAGLGLGLIGLALIGIVPLSGRLTRNLDRLSEGVSRISEGDYRARVEVRSSDEIGTLAAAFNRMAEDVERHQRAAVEQERLRRELELGRQIQSDMLPLPLRLGLTEMRGVSVPAREVGGDFFNYFETDVGKIALLVGDVSGKGVGAALLMANIQASLRTRLALGQDLASIAGALDHELDRDLEASTPGPVYATLFVGLLDPATRQLEYVNAGHNPQYVLRRQGGLERMSSTGLPIGLLAGRGYAARRLQLDRGDVLFFYTDGCVEAEDVAGEMFGVERLEQLVLSAAAHESPDVLAAAEAEIARFRAGREPFDDATMMVVNVG
jgi:serine phosphatase RsbU (regulator of sigma subunit)